MSKIEECLVEIDELINALNEAYDRYEVLHTEFSIMKLQKEKSLKSKGSFSVQDKKRLPTPITATDVEYELSCDVRYKEYLGLKIKIEKLKDAIRLYEMKSRLLLKKH